MPSLTQVRGWDTEHLTEAASHWTDAATMWENAFTHVSTQITNPGGTVWEGVAAEAAQQRAYADRLIVTGLADQLHGAAGVARRGADQMAYAKQRVLDAVQNAEQARFTVGEDFSVSSRESSTPAQMAARRAQAEGFAADICIRVGELVAVDQQTASQIISTTMGVGSATFSDATDPHGGNVQAVDNHTTEPDPAKPPVEGIPPDGVRPPVAGDLTPGPPSRPSVAGRGGQSLWDEKGGEWRYFPGDKWHNPHWDYNSHSDPRSPWDNISINGLPPRIGDPAPIVSVLPPWLQGAPSVSGSPQNPLLAPFPGASMPTAPAPPSGAEPGGPLINMPHIDIPAPDASTGPVAVAGAGALLLLVLGAMALA
jgi:hypothetical protein